MDEQTAGIVTLYYIKQLSPSDAACSKQIKLPRTQARRFVGDLRHKQRAVVTVLDHQNVLWEFLCTCYGCQYALSRVAVFCNTYQLKAGQYLIFYRDSLMRLRVAVTGSLSCKLMRQLTTQMTDGTNCLEQQVLLPELHTSDEEPTDTTEILEFPESAPHEQQLPATSLVQPPAYQTAGGPGHAAFDDPEVAWQQASLQAGQLLQTRTSSGCMYELPDRMPPAQQGGLVVPSIYYPSPDEAATQQQMHMLAAGGLAQQAQQHPGQHQQQHQQQHQHKAFPNPAGCWAPPAAANAGQAPLAPSSAQLCSPHFTLNSPSGYTLVCHERLDELESPDGHDTLQPAHHAIQQPAGQIFSNSSRSCHLDAPAKPANSRMQHADQDQLAVQFASSGKLDSNGAGIRHDAVTTANGIAADARVLVTASAVRHKPLTAGAACNSNEQLRRTAAFRSAGAGGSGNAVAGGAKAPIQCNVSSRSAGQLTAAACPGPYSAALHTASRHMAAGSGMPAAKRSKLIDTSYHQGFTYNDGVVGSGSGQERTRMAAMPHPHTAVVLQHQSSGGSNNSSGYADAAAPAWPGQPQVVRSALPGGCRLLHSGAVMLERSASTPAAGDGGAYLEDGVAAAAAAAAPADTATVYDWDHVGVLGLGSSGREEFPRQQMVYQGAGLATHQQQQLPRPFMAASYASAFDSRGACHHGGVAKASLAWQQLEAEEWSAVTGLMMLSDGVAGPM